MFTDIVGSTLLRDTFIGEHGESDGNRIYRERLLDPHNTRIRAILEKHNGFEVKTNGDSFVVAFAQPEEAVLCAAAIQRSLRGDPIATRDPAAPLAVRIGIHTGTATYVERHGKPDYDGHAVNIAARVESLLKGGERIYCSHETAALAKTAPGLRFHSYGPYLLKGVSQKIEIVEVLWDDAVEPDPPKQPHETLPYPWLTPWVGREREMTALEEALRASRLVTLHGTGGVGKTRTAVETLLARAGGLPREIAFVFLERAADTAEGLLGAVRDAVGLTEVDAPDLDALRRQLQGGDRLLLLDNFESVRSAAASVPRLATIPGVKVLVTSQYALGVNGERVIELEPMETQGDLTTLESYRLFLGLAQQRDARWQPDDDDAMREVLAATDGLPYLIELVAAVASKRTLRQLADELKARLKDVRARGAHALLAGRHASVQACLEWAFARLPTEDRQALPRLAIFADGFDAEAAEAVTATKLESLDVLVDASLLRFNRQSGRYSMLPTTQQFLREFLGEEHTRLAAEHARWFIERLERADDALRAKGGDTQRAAKRWIDAEYENIRQAVAWTERSEPGLFQRAVINFAIFLLQTCRFSENTRLHEEMIHRIDAEAAPKAWAGAQNDLGVMYQHLPTGDRGNNLIKAIACYEAASSIYTQASFPKYWAMTQNNLAIAYRNLPTGDRSQNLAKAVQFYDAALRVYTERDFPVEWAMTQNNLGIAYTALPTGHKSVNLDKAIACFVAALRVYTERDFPIDWAMTQNNLGTAYSELPTGDPSENLAKAITCYKASLRVYTERDFPADWAVTQNNLGIAYADLPTDEGDENLIKAIAFYEAALRIRTEREFPEVWANTQYNLGNAYKRLAAGEPGNHRQQAIICFESAARGYSAVGLTAKAENAHQQAARLVALPI